MYYEEVIHVTGGQMLPEERYRLKAQEMRELAELVTNRDIAAVFLKLAEQYEKLAEVEAGLNRTDE